jgi:transposase
LYKKVKRELFAGEEHVLQAWIGSQTHRLAKRAQVLRLLSTGVSSKDIAKQLSVNEQRVYELDDRYKSEGLLGLLDLPRKGRPSKLSEKGASILLNLLDQSTVTPDSLKKITGELGISVDAIWRRARLSRTHLTRAIRRDLPITAVPLGSTGLVGLLVSASVNISVSLANHKPRDANSMDGTWDISLMDSMVMPVQLDLLAALETTAKAHYRKPNQSFRNDRQLKELYQRWLNTVEIASSDKNRLLNIEIAGDFASDNMLYCLQALKLAIYNSGVERRFVTFMPNFQEWTKRLMPTEWDRTQQRKFSSAISSVCRCHESVFAWTRDFSIERVILP